MLCWISYLDSMEHLCSLFFELANENRLSILIEVSQEPMKLTHISKELDMTVQEVSRHLQRMVDSKLVAKRPDGSYSSTPFGDRLLDQLSGIEFLVKNREYFLTHKIDHLPHKFVSRLGDLKACQRYDNPVQTLQQVNEILASAKEYLWIGSDEVPTGTIPLIEAAVKRDCEFRYLMPRGLNRPTVPDAFMPSYSDEEMQKIWLAVVDAVEVVVVISETAAVVGFPTLEGKMDYLGFQTTDEQGHDWCKDLFLHYWDSTEEKAHPPYLDRIGLM